MKYKVGDRVRIKSFEWYNENKDKNGNVHCGDKVFDDYMSVFCGSVVTIGGVYPYNGYNIREDMYCRAWTDEMIECKVEGIEDRMKELRKMCTISLTDNNYSDKIEVLLNDYEYIEENGKAYFVKKKTEYPKTYEACCKVLGLNHYLGLSWNSYDVYSGVINSLPKRIEDIAKKLESLSKLIICRDAYWKLYGDEMGLGKPWEPPYGYEPIDTFCLQVYQNRITKVTDNTLNHCILTFPTPEMRDAFKENFSKEMENCKELL
jgi:hypothetical protein